MITAKFEILLPELCYCCYGI